jgi:hypothetical protein
MRLSSLQTGPTDRLFVGISVVSPCQFALVRYVYECVYGSKNLTQLAFDFPVSTSLAREPIGDDLVFAILGLPFRALVPQTPMRQIAFECFSMAKVLLIVLSDWLMIDDETDCALFDNDPQLADGVANDQPQKWFMKSSLQWIRRMRLSSCCHIANIHCRTSVRIRYCIV